MLKVYGIKELFVLFVGAVFNRILKKIKYSSKYLPLKREINFFISKGYNVISKREDLLIDSFKRYPFLKFAIRKYTSDIFVFSQVIINEEYYPIVELVKNTTKQEDIKLIVDAGANVGMTSLYFSSFFNDSKIIAIEPELSNFKQLNKNIVLNKLQEKIVSFNNALWINRTDKLSINSEFRDGENWAKSVRLSNDNDILPITLSEIVDNSNLPNVIDILKIDIEGGESELFNSIDFLNILSCNVRFLCIEIHEEFNNKQWYYDIFDRLDFVTFDKNETTFCYNKKFIEN